MRQGIYELSVVDKNGVAFGERVIDGKNYVRAEPGKEYEVRFTIHPDAAGNFPYTCVICIVAIDGSQIGGGFIKYLHSSPFSKPCLTKFREIQISSDKVQSFMFSDVDVSNAAAVANTVNTSKIGQISVTVYEAHRTDRPVNHNPKFKTIAASTCIKEGKKFWQQPSIATAGGSTKTQLYKHPEHVYEKVHPIPNAMLTLQYHAADVLDVLHDLHNKKHAPLAPIPPPVHLDLSAEPEALHVVPVPVEVVDLRQETETAGVVVKVENMQKRRKLGRSFSEQGTVEVVDLTL